MRVIYGNLDDLSKTHIIIARYRLEEVYSVADTIRSFARKHPHYGFLAFAEECRTDLFHADLLDLLRKRVTEAREAGHIHSVFGKEEAFYEYIKDEDIIKVTLTEFPKYGEDEDPIVSLSDTYSEFLGAFHPEPLLKSPLEPLEPWRESLVSRFPEPLPVLSAEVQVRKDYSLSPPRDRMIQDIKDKILSAIRDCPDCWRIEEIPGYLSPDSYTLRVTFQPGKLRTM